MKENSEAPSSHSHYGLDPVVLGTASCLFAAVGYTGVNLCLKFLAVGGADPLWAVCVRESVTVALVGPWLVYLALRGRLAMPPWKTVATLAAVGLAVQLVGNVGVIWAIGQVGLAVAIPIALGVCLAGSAALGAFVLKERVSPRSMAAVGLLIVSVALLHWGAANGDGTDAGRAGATAAVAVACLAGVTFAVLGVAIRKTVTGRVRPTVIVVIVTAMGTLSLAPLTMWQSGVDGVAATPPAQLGVMLLSGLLNLAAFLAITKGFQLTTVVRANVLSATQVAMAGLAGVLLFPEPLRWEVVAGVGLTVIGTLLIGGDGSKN